MLLSTAPLAHSALSAAAIAVAGLQAAHFRKLPHLSRSMTTRTQQQVTGKTVGASEELLSKLQDKELLRTCGFIGGKWSEASSGATYDVGLSRLLMCTHCHDCCAGPHGTPHALTAGITANAPMHASLVCQHLQSL
jgi:hypothetical protein